ncbi:Hypothetical predicted protein [Octopus vulgaris]|uniref:Uncharacterized protein n=1 Tax=Octopus vulgaris TaxID=6645 RepID=A0AA36B2G8_OCTVU|nr:Hypothetical predicted protein [Octopus vulgaris]
MVDTRYKFHLQNKVTRTTTDNGKNFVKAFMQFDTEVELLPDIHEAAADPPVEGVDLDLDLEAGDADEAEYISVDAVLDESSGLGHNLPMHMKRAAHTFCLVASEMPTRLLTALRSSQPTERPCPRHSNCGICRFAARWRQTTFWMR